LSICCKTYCYVAAPFLMPTCASHKSLPCDPGRSRVKLGHQLDQIEHIDHGYLNKKNQFTATFFCGIWVRLHNGGFCNGYITKRRYSDRATFYSFSCLLAYYPDMQRANFLRRQKNCPVKVIKH
jgi:hypothetical protein